MKKDQNFNSQIDNMLEFLELERDFISEKDFIPRVYQAQVETLKRWKSGKTRLYTFITQGKRSSSYKSRRIKNFYNEKIERNLSQKQSVINAISAEFPIFCIQGPPGTGKTSVIIEIIRQELRQNPKKKIIISSQSNLAVDNVLEKLIDIKNVKVLRLGHEEKVTEKIKPYLLNNIKSKLYFKNSINTIVWNVLKFILLSPILMLSKNPKRFNRKKNPDLYQLIASQINVIGATCIGSYDNIVKFLDEEKKSIGLVIVDEAGRSTTMETFVPLQFAQRAVLVGDQKQLPPVLKPEIRTAWIQKFKTKNLDDCPGYYSFFEFISNRMPKEAQSVLNIQFRMHPQIGNFVSQVFYQQEGLTTGITEKANSLPIEGFPQAVSYHPTAKYNQQRFEKFHDGMKSYYNQAEAKVIIQLLKLIDSKNIQAGISVISFYSAQQELIKQLLAKLTLKNIKHVDVATLDSFQGREQDIIILTLVRSAEEVKGFDAGWYRFFLDLKRLNVALSRAKKRLMIVGDLERLMLINRNREKIPGFEAVEQLIKYIDDNNLKVEI